MDDRWIPPVIAGLVLQLVYGGFYASGIFTSRVESPTLTYALGLQSLTISGSMTLTSVLLHKYPPPTSHRPVALVSSVLLLCTGLLPSNNVLLQFSAASVLGVAYGAIYIISIATVQNWVPPIRAALATGVSVAAGGTGTLCLVAMNTQLLNVLTPASAMRMAALLQATVGFLASCMITAPPVGYWPQAGASDPDEETEPLVEARTPRRLSLYELLHDPALYILIFAVAASVGPGFGVVLHGSLMQEALLGITPQVAASRFWWITLCGVLARMGTGLLLDAAGGDLAAARTVTVGLLVVQSAALGAIFSAVYSGSPRLFVALLAVVYAVFGGGSVMMNFIARATFAPENSSLAFSILAVVLGTLDYVFSAIVGGCAAGHPIGGDFVLREHMHEYDGFFVFSLVFSLAACIVGVFIIPGQVLEGEGALGRRIERLFGGRLTGFARAFDRFIPAL